MNKYRCCLKFKPSQPAEAHFHTFNVVSSHKSAIIAQPSDEEIKLLILIKKEAVHR